MRTQIFLRYVLLFAAALIALTACDAEGIPRIASVGGPRVWLDQPPDGANLPLGPFTLKAHARDTSGGVRQITFLVNGTPIGSVNTDPSADLAYAEISWNASVPGTYLLVASATNPSGTSSLSDPVRVCVGPSCEQTAATPTPASAGTSTPTPASQLTGTPTPQTGCSGKPNVASFTATPNSITAGASVTLRWSVTNATEVAIVGTDGTNTGIAPFSGTRNVSPPSTTTYTLIALCNTKENFVEVPLIVTVTAPPATATRTRTPTATQPPATPTRTATTPSQTGCSGLPVIASFSASPSSISAGGSSTLSWGAVTNADSVEVNQGIGGVGTPGSTTVSPGATTTYTMTARCGQNTTTRTATITVQAAPSDTTPPSVSSPSWNPKTVNYPCSPSVLTVNSTASDASGIQSVTFNYRFQNTSGTPVSPWLTAPMSSMGGGNYRIDYNIVSQANLYLVGSFGRLEFYITARDNAGNTSPASSSGIVDVQNCPG